jgi:hypothetical protein
MSDLDLEIMVAGVQLTQKLNLSFTTDIANDTKCRVNVATRDYVQGELPPDAAVIADVDVFTT